MLRLVPGGDGARKKRVNDVADALNRVGAEANRGEVSAVFIVSIGWGDPNHDVKVDVTGTVDLARAIGYLETVKALLVKRAIG